MKIRGFLLAGTVVAISFYGAGAHASVPAAPNKLKPRIEAVMKLGTERHIGMTEAWIPLAQDENSVFYGDMRFMRDNTSNTEGNFGLGFRSYNPEIKHIMGVHTWIDRRKTKLGSEMYQMTIGGEYFTKNYELRINGYIPLSGRQIQRGPNGGSASAYIAGSGLFFDTNSTIAEVPQGGFDLELGTMIPTPFDEITDSTRLYAAGYRFSGGGVEDVEGWRMRFTTDVNGWLALGGRWQRDDVRGGQGFLEATFRFPGRAAYKQQGLRARLDESPERDIDIVSGAVTVDTGLRKPVVNSTGASTRAIVVDNTAAAGGDGSSEKPYNTLAAAEAALQPYDLVYIKSGNGSSAGMNTGILINQPGVRIIGSGSDFDLGNGIVLKSTGAYPVITNTGGSGIRIRASGITVAGLKVDGSTAEGIDATNNNLGTWESVSIDRVISVNNANRQIYVFAQNGGIIRNVSVTDSQVSTNLSAGLGRGIEARSENANSRIENVLFQNNIAKGLREQIFQVYARNGGVIERATIVNNLADTTINGGGFRVWADSGISRIGEVTLSGNIARNTYGSLSYGIFINSEAGIGIDKVILSNNTSQQNTTGGIAIQATGASYLQSVVLSQNIVSGNHAPGIYLNDDTSNFFNVNLGDGLSGGRNSIYENSSSDLRLDLDNGSVQAQGNWWGSSAGPQAGQIANEGACGACGTANTANFLTSAP